jgi:hypothetical protein
MPEGGRLGTVTFAKQAEPAAYIAGARGTTPPVGQPDRLLEALTQLR